MKPRVARNELPWVKDAKRQQPQRGCGKAPYVQPSRNPVGVFLFYRLSQGSSFLATPGFVTQSLIRFPQLFNRFGIGRRSFRT